MNIYISPISSIASSFDVNQSINQRNFYSATYKKWTAALDNVNI